MLRNMDSVGILVLLSTFIRAGGYSKIDADILHRSLGYMARGLTERARKTGDRRIVMSIVIGGHSEALSDFINKRTGENGLKTYYERERRILDISEGAAKMIEDGANSALEKLSGEERAILLSAANNARTFYQGTLLQECSCDR